MPIIPDGHDVPSKANSIQHLPSQTILEGTALRDKILRAFQEDYIPYSPPLTHDTLSSSPVTATAQRRIETTTDGIVPVIHELKPDDLDAIPDLRVVATEDRAKSILSDNQLIQSWTKRYRSSGEVVEVEGDPKVELNGSQMRAIAMMLSERLSLVQGVSISSGLKGILMLMIR
jgi:hypothetical protein